MISSYRQISYYEIGERYLSNLVILSHLISSLLHPNNYLGYNLLTEFHLFSEIKKAIFVKSSSDLE